MLLENHNAIEVGGYAISNSLRFQSASSQYLSRTFASGTNEKTSTLSMWVKRGTLGSQRILMSVAGGGSNECNLYFGGDDKLAFQSWNGSSRPLGTIETSAVFRDPSAWYHIVFVVDTGNVTSSERLRFYVNGTRQDLSVASYPSQNAVWYWNGTYSHRIGAYSNTLQAYFDGYLTEVNFIDGQALTPSSFGQTDPTTGQWVAKKYVGTYGTNGFYLPFSNGTSTTTLGADSSGNGNNWTLNNFTRSAGVSDCWMIDVPSGNGGVSGTQPSSNYAVMNPLKLGASQTLTKSNLNVSGSGWGTTSSTLAVTTGKWYWEITSINSAGTAANPSFMIGVSTDTSNNQSSYNAAGVYHMQDNGDRYYNGTSDTRISGVSIVTNDVVMLAYDADAGKLWIGKNGTWFNSGSPTGGTGQIYSSIPTTGITPSAAASGAGAYQANFGQRSFAYTPPTGFKALCTANLP